MGLFWKKKDKVSNANNFDDVIAWGIKNAQNEEARRYYEGQADTEYQEDLKRFYDLITEIRESYSVINAVGSFSEKPAERLIDRCAVAIALDIELKEKREYYENHVFDMSEPAKTLAMVFEKRQEYENAAGICALAIENGFTADGTNGGMRGRLARMIKKGKLSLTDEYKKILNLE